MRIARWFLPLILLLDFNGIPSRFNAGQTTQSGAQEAQELARRFAKRLEETRDFNPVVKELFVKRFLDCHLRTMLEGKENGIFSQEGLSVPLDVAGQSRRDELQHYLLARLNFFHLQTLHRLSTRDLKGRFDDSFYTAEQGYPPGVYKLMMTNSLIAATTGDDGKGRIQISIKSVQDLRSVLPTLEQAAWRMGEYFKTHPPEETELYRKNMSSSAADSRFWEIHLFKLAEKDSEAADRCFGIRVNLMTAIKVPPIYRAFIVQEGKQLRIATLLCTDPPCVD